MSARRLGAALALLTLASACDSGELTQVVLVVDSDSNDFERVKIAFEQLSQVDAIEIDPREQKLPRRVTLVHDGGPLGPFGVTVSAFGSDHNDPVLVEPRRQLFFERGQARMLKIDLLQACIGQCNAGQACLGAAVCESSSSDAATRLVNWSGEAGPLDMHDEPPAAGASGGGEAGAGMIEIPEMPVMPVSAFPYTPTNFDAKGAEIPGDRVTVVLDCGGEPTFDSSEGRFSAWCGAEPFAAMVQQRDGSEAMLLVMDTLSIAAGTTLRLVGSRPVILAVYGDADVLGAIDASAAGATPGAGGNVDCGAAAGTSGTDASSGMPGPSGGGGGGFGSAGGKGGGSDSTLSVAGGSTLGDAALSPLRGGCPGGNGGLGAGTSAALGGAGGGAVQLSAAGRLTVAGWIAANGAGGQATATLRDGGGGGGSGGAILLEANQLIFDAAAVVVANGGGGGGGNPTALDERASAGANGGRSVLPASGGEGPYSGGRGGGGAARATSAEDGEDAEQSQLSEAYGAGGGGGGGAGRIRVAQDACIARGTFSPALDDECTSGAPAGAELPTSQCTVVDSGGRSWVHCSDRLSWSDAQASCASANLMLAEIDDEEEQRALVNVARGYSWLGARDASVEGEWAWERSGVTFWSEALDDAVGGAFTDWASTQPDSGTRDQDCMAESQFGWIDQDCSETLAYFCEPAAQ